MALESSACGAAVVASEVGGLTTLIEQGVTGFLVDDRDSSLWADTVTLALDSEATMTLSNAAVLRARHYTWRRAQRSVRSAPTGA